MSAPETDRPAVLWEGEVPFGDSAGGVGMGAARVVRLPQRGWSAPLPLAVERRYLDALCAPRWDPADERERGAVLEQAVRDLAGAIDEARAAAPEGEPQGEERRPLLIGRRYVCPCGAEHTRGPVNGDRAYRCLRCGDVRTVATEDIQPERAPDPAAPEGEPC